MLIEDKKIWFNLLNNYVISYTLTIKYLYVTISVRFLLIIDQSIFIPALYVLSFLLFVPFIFCSFSKY